MSSFDIPAPLFSDIDLEEEKSLSFTWCFGPQGHPASMRVWLLFSQEKEYKPSLYILGPLASPAQFNAKEFSPDDLKALTDYGMRIEKEFGANPKWHRCTKAKHKIINCGHCEKIRKRERERAKTWLKKNPLQV